MPGILEEDYLNIANSSDFNKDELFGSTVLITGATGLVGMFLAKSLIYMNTACNAGIRLVLPVRNKNKADDLYKDTDLKDVTFIYGDITEEPKVDGDVDYIIHCASNTTSKYMVSNPVETLHISYEGTRQMLKLAADKNVKSMVYVSSMEVYGSTKEEDNPITEDKLGFINVHNVRSSYSEGKRICELLCSSYASEYGVPVKMARLAQTFGAGVPSSDTRVFAQFARSVINGTDIVLHTKGESVGNYCYTADVVRGILCLLTKGEDGEAYNVVNENTSMMIREVASMVSEEIAEGKIKVIFDIPEQNAFGYAPDTKMRLSSKKINELGWKASYDLPDMYRRMISYWEE